MLTVEDVARICHEANRAYCVALGDETQQPWLQAPEWARESAINGVRFHIANPNATDAASHQAWLNEKVLAGWKYGPVKDEKKKEHPCFKPFDELPTEQQLKDAQFRA